jgi:DNA-dependent RNA polymerase auxiliary subunit epsilon
MKNRPRKRRLYAKVQAFKRARHWMTEEEYAWEFMPPIGREFGSQDYERPIEQDAIKKML